jgi:hypothetical protein
MDYPFCRPKILSKSGSSAYTGFILGLSKKNKIKKTPPLPDLWNQKDDHQFFFYVA